MFRLGLYVCSFLMFTSSVFAMGDRPSQLGKYTCEYKYYSQQGPRGPSRGYRSCFGKPADELPDAYEQAVQGCSRRPRARFVRCYKIVPCQLIPGECRQAVPFDPEVE